MCKNWLKRSSPKCDKQRPTIRGAVVAIRVAINGFGRIGRGYLRASLNNPNIDVVAANDLTSIEVNAHLLRYDSTQGRLDRTVTVTDEGIVVGDETVKIYAERNPTNLPWKDLGIDVVICLLYTSPSPRDRQ